MLVQYVANAATMPRRAYKKVAHACIVCGVEFLGRKDRKTCSRSCARKLKCRTRRCERCHNEFRSDSGRARYCSPECAHPVGPRLRRIRTCKECGARYLVKRKDNQGWCSKACANRSMARAKSVRACRHCRSRLPFGSKARYCSDACRKASRGNRLLAMRLACVVVGGPVAKPSVCVWCGQTWIPQDRRRRMFCSRECARKAARKTSKHKRRQRIRSGHADKISVHRLIERDLGQCHLCRNPVDVTACVPSEMAPTIDHVIPLAKGGTHTWGNVALAHFGCNYRKRDRQTTLF